MSRVHISNRARLDSALAAMPTPLLNAYAGLALDGQYPPCEATSAIYAIAYEEFAASLARIALERGIIVPAPDKH